MNPPIIVDLRCPAWKVFAMLGDANSTMSCRGPESGFVGSRRPRLLLYPYASFCDRIVGNVRRVIASGLKLNRTNDLSAFGGCTSGDSGNYIKKY